MLPFNKLRAGTSSGILHKAQDRPFELPVGRLVEISAAQANHAQMTTAVAALLRAQAEGETCAWIQPTLGPLYPPDLADSQVDLDALVVVHIPQHAGAFAYPKAAELLLRSGAFGILVIDLTSVVLTPLQRATNPWQGRLLGLARQHTAQVLLLTNTPTTQSSLGALIGLRLSSKRKRVSPEQFCITLQTLKNKTGHSMENMKILRRGPWGLR